MLTTKEADGEHIGAGGRDDRVLGSGGTESQGQSSQDSTRHGENGKDGLGLLVACSSLLILPVPPLYSGIGYSAWLRSMSLGMRVILVLVPVFQEYREKLGCHC